MTTDPANILGVARIELATAIDAHTVAENAAADTWFRYEHARANQTSLIAIYRDHWAVAALRQLAAKVEVETAADKMAAAERAVRRLAEDEADRAADAAGGQP